MSQPTENSPVAAPETPAPKPLGRPKADETTRFMAKCQAPAHPGACVLWGGTISAQGYPVIAAVVRPDGSFGLMQARRYLWWKLHGVDAPSPIIATCGNPRCMTPAHLSLRTATRTATSGRSRHQQAWADLMASESLLRAFLSRRKEPATTLALSYGLTPKQAEILRGVTGQDRLAQLVQQRQVAEAAGAVPAAPDETT